MKTNFTIAFSLVSLFTTAQNVGIGTTLPEYTLHVLRPAAEASVGINATGTASKAMLNLSIDNRIGGNALTVIKYRPGVAGSTAGIPLNNLSVIAADAGAGALLISTNQASPIHFAINGTERMFIGVDGKIGIGTPSPVAFLELQSLTDNTLIRAHATGAGSYTGLQMSGDGGTTELIRFGTAYPGAVSGVLLSNLSSLRASLGSLLIGNSTNDPFYFTTNNVVRMRLTGDGRLGINESDPPALLAMTGRNDIGVTALFDDPVPTGHRSVVEAHLNTNTAASSAISGATFEGGGVASLEAVTYGVMGQSGNNGYAVAGYSLASTALRAKSNTGLSLHTTGSLKLDGISEALGNVLTSDADGNAKWQALPASAGTWAVNGTHIYNTNTGNVGIGITTPTSNLHVRSSTVTEITVGTTDNNAAARLTMQTPFGTSEVSHFGNTVALTVNGLPYNNLTRLYSAGGSVMAGNSGNNPLYLVTNDFPRLMITGNGNVAINTSTGIDAAQLKVERSGTASIGVAWEAGAILGITQNTSQGSGVLGVTTAPRMGTINYAGVTGTNLSTGVLRFGVIGNSNGTSSGSSLSAGVGGFGDYGVLGYSQSTTGAGVIAQAIAGQTALELNNGFIKVSGTAVNRTAFTITATAANSSGYILTLDYANQSKSDILIVTHNYNPPGITEAYYNYNVGVYWDGGTAKWHIYNENTVSPILGISFNVLVIKQ